jgi:hypothetical protein
MNRFKEALPPDWAFWLMFLGLAMFAGGLIVQVCLAIVGNLWAVAYVALPILLGGAVVVITVTAIEPHHRPPHR